MKIDNASSDQFHQVDQVHIMCSDKTGHVQQLSSEDDNQCTHTMKRKAFHQYPNEPTPLDEMSTQKYKVSTNEGDSFPTSLSFQFKLPSHQEPYIYSSSHFLAQYLFQHFSNMERLDNVRLPSHILELGAGFSAVPSVFCVRYFLCRERRLARLVEENDGMDQIDEYTDHSMIQEGVSESSAEQSCKPQFHVYITDGADNFDSMSELWRENLRINLQNYMKDSTYESVDALIDDCCSFSNVKWNNFFELPPRVNLILAADTIHNRDKESWEDFFACVSYCLSDTHMKDVPNEVEHSNNSPTDRRLLMAYQRRDDNETIVHLLEKWNLTAKVVKTDGRRGLILFEIRSTLV
mmetsp:Transcript_2731/g.10495  ORF Transcript_2731/g.10495 Transcript_2731/m.10495 type:complete len:350 (+) Transcript_2731:678-1727(+)